MAGEFDFRVFPSSRNLRVKTSWKSAIEQLLVQYGKTSLCFLVYIYVISFLDLTLHIRYDSSGSLLPHAIENPSVCQ